MPKVMVHEVPKESKDRPSLSEANPKNHCLESATKECYVAQRKT